VIGGDIAGLDFRPNLRKLKMPILVLAGRFDRVSLPRYAVEYKKYAPQARFMMMEESGHFPFIEEPEATVAILLEFLHE
jgi:proline iminopeptidase